MGVGVGGGGLVGSRTSKRSRSVITDPRNRGRRSSGESAWISSGDTGVGPRPRRAAGAGRSLSGSRAPPAAGAPEAEVADDRLPEPDHFTKTNRTRKTARTPSRTVWRREPAGGGLHEAFLWRAAAGTLPVAGEFGTGAASGSSTKYVADLHPHLDRARHVGLARDADVPDDDPARARLEIVEQALEARVVGDEGEGCRHVRQRQLLHRLDPVGDLNRARCRRASTSRGSRPRSAPASRARVPTRLP